MLPKEYEQQVHRYVGTHQSRSIAARERAPFRRQLDFWAFSIACALATGMDPLENTSKCRKFIDTRAITLGDELSELIAAVAFDKIGHNDPGASDPSEIVEMCNRLAGAGAGIVLKKLEESFGSTPLEKALDLASLLRTENDESAG